MTENSRERPSPDPQRVLVVDDHDLFGQSLTMALRAAGYVTTRADDVTPAGVMEAATQLDPHVVLLDLHLGPDGPTGLAMIPPLCERETAVVMVTGVEEPARIAECLEAGAVSVVSKSAALEHLRHSVSEAVEGRSVVDPGRRAEAFAALRRERAERARNLARFGRLSPSERAVLAALLDGRPAEAIAAERYVSLRTVRTQIEAILSKLGVHSQLGAVAMARRAGWDGS